MSYFNELHLRVINGMIQDAKKELNLDSEVEVVLMTMPSQKIGDAVLFSRAQMMPPTSHTNEAVNFLVFHAKENILLNAANWNFVRPDNPVKKIVIGIYDYVSSHVRYAIHVVYSTNPPVVVN